MIIYSRNSNDSFPEFFPTLIESELPRNIVLDCVKKAQNHDAIIFRFYEALGGHSNLKLSMLRHFDI